jgi:hypothetical protein
MVTQLSAAITTLFFNYIALKYAGQNGVAAVTIILFIQFVMTSVYLGHTAGVSPIISSICGILFIFCCVIFLKRYKKVYLY